MQRVVILGGGAGGISIAARLSKVLPAGSVTLVEPSETHYYQPLWTLVGAGVLPKAATARSQQSLIPRGVVWKKASVSSVNPADRHVHLDTGESLGYDYLVVATGLQVRFDMVAGLEEALKLPYVSSIYDLDSAEKTCTALQGFTGGRAIFTMPPVPIKCAGAPQKIAYLADDMFRKSGVRGDTELIFATAGAVIFGIPAFAETLKEVVRRKGIKALYNHRLVSVDGPNKKATFEITSTKGEPTRTETFSFDYLHAVPPMRAHAWVSDSGLAFKDGPHAGWLAVDKHSLAHVQYPEIFGIGDVTGVPNSKTGAAIRKQAPVVVENLVTAMRGGKIQASYDGYSACPLVTSFNKGVLAEFGYDGKLMPSFPGNPARETRFLWVLKRYLLPMFYWRLMLKGHG